ncbi:MAG: winged helix-turn-helix transcriptional regulator [candidate division NC10 bacterium]
MSVGELPTASMRARRLIEEYPGLHLRELARRLDLDVRAAQHHLSRLEKSGYVTVLRFGRFMRYFPRRGKHQGEVVDQRDKKLLAHLRNSIALSLVVHLISFGPSRLAELSDKVKVSPSRASFHLRKLEGAGIVVRRKKRGPKYDVEDAERLKALLRTYRPLPDQVDGLLDLWDAFVGAK